MAEDQRRFEVAKGDALILVDAQNDFFEGGSLAVQGANEILPAVNKTIALFHSKGLPIFATRDWHPLEHCSFKAQGGPWPPHCVAGSKGALFHPGIHLPDSTAVISTATTEEKEAYSGFEGTDLTERLRAAGINRLVIGGLATDYCVLHTVKDALKNGFDVFLLLDAVKAVNVAPDDGKKAIQEMIKLGSLAIDLECLF